MNILWITDRPPCPPDTGGKIVVHSRIRSLAARGHAVYLLSLYDWKDLAEVPEDFRSCCAGVELFPRPSVPISAAQSLWWSWPVASRYSPALVRRIREILRSGRIDVLQVEYSVMSANALAALEGLLAVARCLNFHDYGETALRTLAERLPRLSPRRALYEMEARRKGRYDRRLIQDETFDVFLFVSADDLNRAADQVGDKRPEFRHIPIGVDLADCVGSSVAALDSDEEPADRTILFVGSFADETNTDAVRWFAREVFPRLPADLGVRLLIVGRHAVEILSDLEGPSVSILQDVPDIRPYLGRASVFIAPIFSGAGTRVKLLDALAAGLLVVGTDKAFEGTRVRHGTHVLRANTADEFVAVLKDVLARPYAFRRIAEAGHAYVVAEHSPAHVAEALEQAYKIAVTTRARRGRGGEPE